MAELLYDIHLHEWAVPSPLTSRDKCQKRSAVVYYMATLSGQFLSLCPSAKRKKITLDQSWERIQKGVRLCVFEGEADLWEVSKAETKTPLAYFYERRGKTSLPISFFPPRIPFGFLAYQSVRWVGEGLGWRYSRDGARRSNQLNVGRRCENSSLNVSWS